MNIHRNTLLYRLERIRQIAGIDLEDVNTCTHLLISFHLIG
jgi:DNA-binding PucR family transcriptional regulator